MEVNGQFHALAILPWGKTPGTHSIGSWAGPKADFDDVQEGKILPLQVIKPRPSSL
jgi:hypothetical protein